MAWLFLHVFLFPNLSKHFTDSHENGHELCAVEVHPNSLLPNLLLPVITRWRTREIMRQEGH